MPIEALEESLQEALDGEHGALPYRDEGFVIDDDSKADWALRKIAQAKRKLADAQKLAEMETSRIQVWLTEQRKGAESSIAYFEGLLSQYMQQVRANDPKAKSHKLPHGRLQLRRSAQWSYDDAALLAWLQANRPELVRVKHEPDKAGLKKTVTVDAAAGRVVDPSTGEAIPGVTVTEIETFSTEVD